MNILRDSFGRTFPYIRLSITDVCNFKCGYCLPNGYQIDKSDNRKFLHLEEIRRLAKVFSKLGVCKIRLTGGEPTVRKDFFDIIKILKNEAGIKKVVITTNGYHLDEKAKMLVDSHLARYIFHCLFEHLIFWKHRYKYLQNLPNIPRDDLVEFL